MNQPPLFCFANEAVGVSCGERAGGRREKKIIGIIGVLASYYFGNRKR